MIVIDTPVLVWWITGSKSLSSSATVEIEKVLKNESTIIISSISVWEIAMLIDKQRLIFNMDLNSWIEEVSQIEGVQFVLVDNEISIKSTRQPGDFHKDPADRMIVATARKFAVPLITADEKIRAYRYVETIW